MGCCASSPEEHSMDIERKEEKQVKVGDAAAPKTSVRHEEEAVPSRRNPDQSGAY